MGCPSRFHRTPLWGWRFMLSVFLVLAQQALLDLPLLDDHCHPLMLYSFHSVVYIESFPIVNDIFQFDRIWEYHGGPRISTVPAFPTPCAWYVSSRRTEIPIVVMDLGAIRTCS